MRQAIEDLYAKDLIREDQKNTLQAVESGKVFSLFYELRIILFLSISLLNAGVAILVYQNIDTIGHQVIIFAIACAIVGIIYFVHTRSLPFATGKGKETDSVTEYLLLLASVLFGILIGYLQFVYSIFGTCYMLLTIVPAIFYFALAYRFDHKGVLCLGITALASTIGLSFQPIQFWKNDFINNSELIVPAIIFSISMMIAAYYFKKISFKAHFMPTYFYFSILLLLFATTSGLLCFQFKFLWFLFLIAVCGLSFNYAKQFNLFIYFMLSVLFAYFGLSYVLYLLVEKTGSDWYLFYYYYIIASSIGVILVLYKHKSILK